MRVKINGKLQENVNHVEASNKQLRTTNLDVHANIKTNNQFEVIDPVPHVPVLVGHAILSPYDSKTYGKST